MSEDNSNNELDVEKLKSEILNKREQFILRLAEIQEDTAAIDLKIGGTSDSNQVKHDRVYIQNAPGRVVERVVEEFFNDDQVYISQEDEGMEVVFR